MAQNRPWVVAFWAELALPCGVLGPVDFWAFWRLDWSLRWEIVVVAVVATDARVTAAADLVGVETGDLVGGEGRQGHPVDHQRHRDNLADRVPRIERRVRVLEDDLQILP